MKSPVIQTLLSVLLAGGAVAWAADDSSFAAHLAKEPTAKSLRTIAEDQQYKFAGHHFGTGSEDGAASVYVFSQSARQWARIDQIATRDAVLGRAPDMDKVMLAVGWDHAGLENQQYSAIPLRCSQKPVGPAS